MVLLNVLAYPDILNHRTQYVDVSNPEIHANRIHAALVLYVIRHVIQFVRVQNL